MGTFIGYCRVSTTDQNEDAQVGALQAAGCTTIRVEKKSGTTTKGRTELATVLAFIHAGDTLVVTRIDRLARSVGDLADIMRTLEAKGAGLKATEQPVNTTTPEGRAFLGMLSVFVQFETEIRKERQMEGIAAAKQRGVYKGRPAKLSVGKVRELRAAGIGASKIAKQLGIARASVYRLLSSEAETKGV